MPLLMATSASGLGEDARVLLNGVTISTPCKTLLETVRKENEMALQRAEMRMVRWMCDIKVKDRVPSKQLRDRLGIDDIILVLQQNRLPWYGQV